MHVRDSHGPTFRTAEAISETLVDSQCYCHILQQYKEHV